MSKRPTPETDAFSGNLGDCIKFAEKLKRQRDEAREQANVMHEQWLSKGRCCENLAEELHEVKQQRDELREELEILRSNKMSDPLLETTFKHLIRERDEAIIKYTGEANELERQRNHAIAKCEDARRDLAEAKEALKKIMNTEIKRVVDMGTQQVFKLITINTENNETIFEGKLNIDSGMFKDIIDEEALLKEIESIPSLLLKS